MRNPVQRITAICDALVNNSATPAQIARVGVALAARFGRVGEYNIADNQGKATIATQCVRRVLLDIVREYEGSAAAATASATAEGAFPETP